MSYLKAVTQNHSHHIICENTIFITLWSFTSSSRTAWYFHKDLQYINVSSLGNIPYLISINHHNQHMWVSIYQELIIIMRLSKPCLQIAMSTITPFSWPTTICKLSNHPCIHQRDINMYLANHKLMVICQNFLISSTTVILNHVRAKIYRNHVS